MSLTINHQTNDISNATGTILVNGVAVGGDNSPTWYGSRGIWGGGVTINTISYATIQTAANTVDFGGLTVAHWGPGSTAGT